MRDIEEKFRKLASIRKPQTDKFHQFWLSGDSQERREAEELLDIELWQRVEKDYRERVFLDPPEKTLCEGQYELGSVMYPPGKEFCKFGLREEEWCRHVMIAGMTGMGKTNLSFGILQRLVENHKPFLVFDWKRNYRDLVSVAGFEQLQVFTVGRDVSPFFFNPLIPPPGLGHGEWLMKLVDVLKHSYFVGDGVEFLLREAIDAVYEQCQVFSATQIREPDFYQVRDYIHRKRADGRMALWKASAIRVLESICFRHGLGPVMNSGRTWDHDAILSRPVVMELDALSDADKTFFTEAMILWLYEFRKMEDRREEFKHCVLIEESHHVLSQMKERASGQETIMETCLRQIREFGESVICIDQEPSKLSNSMKANTFLKICFNLGNGEDILDMSVAMALNQEEAGYVALLDVGKAIAVMKGRVFAPLYVQFPHFPIRKGSVTDAILTSWIDTQPAQAR